MGEASMRKWMRRASRDLACCGQPMAPTDPSRGRVQCAPCGRVVRWPRSTDATEPDVARYLRIRERKRRKFWARFDPGAEYMGVLASGREYLVRAHPDEPVEVLDLA